MSYRRILRITGTVALATLLGCGGATEPSDTEHQTSGVPAQPDSPAETPGAQPDVPPDDGILRPTMRAELAVDVTTWTLDIDVDAVATLGDEIWLGGPDGLWSLGGSEPPQVVDGAAVISLHQQASGLVVGRTGAVSRRLDGREVELVKGDSLAVTTVGAAVWAGSAEVTWIVAPDGGLRQLDSVGSPVAMYAHDASGEVVVEREDGTYVLVETDSEGTRRTELNTRTTFDFAFPLGSGGVLASIDGELVERRRYAADPPSWYWRSLGEGHEEVRIDGGAHDPATGLVWVVGGDHLYRLTRNGVEPAKLPLGLGQIRWMRVSKDGRLWMSDGELLVALRAERPAPEPAARVDSPTFADVRSESVVACAACHDGGQAATSVPLATHADWVAATDAAIASLETNTMPPPPAAPRPEFAELLRAWRDNGFPEEATDE